MSSSSDIQPGRGVPREKIQQKRIPVPAEDMPPVQHWQDRPCVVDQFTRYPDTVRPGHVEVKIFDLSNPEELKEYNRIISNASSSTPSLAVTAKDTQFSKKTDNWKVLIQIQHYQFLKLTPDATPKPTSRNLE